MARAAKEKRDIVDSFDRALIAELGKKKFKTLQAEVRSPHEDIDYSRHIQSYADNEVLYGFELEIEKSPKYHSLKKLLDEYLGYKQYYVCTDGSLRDSGVEIVSLPLSKQEWMQRYSKLHNLLTALSKAGCRSHDVETCGLHIAVSAHALNWHSWNNLAQFIVANRSFFERISRRRNFTYCEMGYVDPSRKYSALNLSHINRDSNQTLVGSANSRAEFRFFRGTLLPRSFISSLECIFALMEFARGSTMGEDWSLARFKKVVSEGKYYNLQDYLFEAGELDAPSKRSGDEGGAMAKKKAAAEKAKREKEERIVSYLQRLRDCIGGCANVVPAGSHFGFREELTLIPTKLDLYNHVNSCFRAVDVAPTIKWVGNRASDPELIEATSRLDMKVLALVPEEDRDFSGRYTKPIIIEFNADRFLAGTAQFGQINNFRYVGA